MLLEIARTSDIHSLAAVWQNVSRGLAMSVVQSAPLNADSTAHDILVRAIHLTHTVNMRRVLSTVLVVCVVCSVLGLAEPWIFRRRRRRYRCTAKNCQLTNWGSWGACSVSCGGGGKQTRTRSRTAHETCGGTCPHLSESQSCNSKCCPVDCAFSWAAWSSCGATCGWSTQRRSAVVTTRPSCRGKRCPGPQTKSCDASV